MEGKTNFFKVLETVWWPDLTDADPIFYATARVATTLLFVHTASETYMLVPTWCNLLSRTQFSSDVCRFASNWAVGGGRLSGYMIFGIGNLLGLGGGWGRSSNFDLASLPPCRSALQQHIYRSNYQVGVWKRAHIAKPWTRRWKWMDFRKWCNATKVDRWRSDAKRIGRHSRRINWRFWYWHWQWNWTGGIMTLL